jgi:hypothetical protein
VRLALSIVVLTGLAVPARATPGGDLDAARKSFREHDWDKTVKLATPLIYPDEKLGSPDDIVEAHVLLGASDFELGDSQTAHREFEKALEIERDRELTRNVFSDGVVKLFDDTKAELDRQDRAREQEEKDAIVKQQVETYIANMHVYEAHPYFVNFVPFGAGQFQNHQRRRGVLLAIGEGATLGVSAGIWFYLVGTYGISASNVPLSSAQTVRTLQQVEIGTGVACIGLYALGVVDSLLHYRPSELKKSDESLLPPELRPKKKTSLLDRLHVVPIAARGGGGLGLALENY